MRTVLLIALSCYCLPAICQIEATTKDGKKIILNSDGTWKYAEQSAVKAVGINTDCSELITNQVDKVTGKTTRTTKESIIASKDRKNGLLMLLFDNNGTLILLTTAVGAGACIDDANKMNILFEMEQDLK